MTGQALARPRRNPKGGGQWTSHMDIKSQTSSRMYTVAEQVIGGRPTGLWGCNCPGWIGYGGQCKHLLEMGLPSCRPRRQPARRGQGTGDNTAFTDAAFRHYSPAVEGFGSPGEWITQLEQLAAGRGKYVPRGRPLTAAERADLRLLGLPGMPADAPGLVRAMRKKARVLHPDVVHPTDGNHRLQFPQCPQCLAAAEAFTAMTDAYDRLLNGYAT